MPFLFDNVIREDSYAQIMCVVTEGDPPFSIAWSFHGHNLTSSNLQIRTSNIGDRTSLLMIPNVSYKHMGNYTCKVSNKAGSSSHTAILKVNGNPWLSLGRGKLEIGALIFLCSIFHCNNGSIFWCFLTEPPEILPFNFGKEVLDEGDFAHVSCIVTKGDMPISMSWSLQGDQVSVSDSSISTSQAGPRASFLSITSVSNRHTGVYTCTASNVAGTSTFSTELKVNGTIFVKSLFSRKKKRNSSATKNFLWPLSSLPLPPF